MRKPTPEQLALLDRIDAGPQIMTDREFLTGAAMVRRGWAVRPYGGLLEITHEGRRLVALWRAGGLRRKSARQFVGVRLSDAAMPFLERGAKIWGTQAAAVEKALVAQYPEPKARKRHRLM